MYLQSSAIEVCLATIPVHHTCVCIYTYKESSFHQLRAVAASNRVMLKNSRKHSEINGEKQVFLLDP